MEYADPNALVSTEWLAERHADPTVRIADASWYLPAANRSGKDEYAERHIPGAVHWDITEIADLADSLPHMLPDATLFAQHMARLWIGDGMRVVFYDGGDMSTATRACGLEERTAGRGRWTTRGHRDGRRRAPARVICAPREIGYARGRVRRFGPPAATFRAE